MFILKTTMILYESIYSLFNKLYRRRYIYNAELFRYKLHIIKVIWSKQRDQKDLEI